LLKNILTNIIYLQLRADKWNFHVIIILPDTDGTFSPKVFFAASDATPNPNPAAIPAIQ
jgi:hypothetical protein